MVLLLPRQRLAITAAPGTGSTSLLAYFGSRDGAITVPVTDHVVGGEMVVDAKHAPVAAVVAAGLLDEDTVRDMRILTGTRNPFDFWAAEWHRTRTRWLDELQTPTSWVHSQRGMPDRIAAAVDLEFDAWVDVALGDHRRSGRTMHLNPGHVAEADVVVRMEHLDEDVAALVEAAAPGLPVPHINATSGRPHYRQLYGRRARELVASVHAPDLERFAYRF